MTTCGTIVPNPAVDYSGAPSLNPIFFSSGISHYVYTTDTTKVGAYKIYASVAYNSKNYFCDYKVFVIICTGITTAPQTIANYVYIIETSGTIVL
jgi:hypothetical protein